MAVHSFCLGRLALMECMVDISETLLLVMVFVVYQNYFLCFHACSSDIWSKSWMSAFVTWY